MEAILAWRRPAAVVALVALTVEVALLIAAFGAALARQGELGSSLVFSLPVLGPTAAVLTLTVGLLVGSCCREPVVPGSRGLARWAVVLALVSVLIGLLRVAVGLATLPPRDYLFTVLEPVTGLVVPGLVAWGLVVISRAASNGSSPAVEESGEPVVASPAAEAADVAQQPTWAPDAASGAVWRTAGEAARGAPASGWGASGWAATPTPGWDADTDTDVEGEGEGETRVEGEGEGETRVEDEGRTEAESESRPAPVWKSPADDETRPQDR